ncbi:aminotransferase class V-fold PLP-dependent enzyme, partial [Streptomyces diastaticus]|uniref:aminotransferase class V-fold PLP-dependent enzyme n=1 Tax=Streptomyces diastaticus TaxID=1956 RepID=UPI00365EE157
MTPEAAAAAPAAAPGTRPGDLRARRARLLLDAAREAAAETVGCRPDELTFTTSGTRAVHTGVAGVLGGRRRVGRHLIVSAVEHSCVLHAADTHE